MLIILQQILKYDYGQGFIKFVIIQKETFLKNVILYKIVLNSN